MKSDHHRVNTNATLCNYFILGTVPNMYTVTTASATRACNSVESKEELQGILDSRRSALLMLHMDWCGPCKQALPLFRAANLSVETHDVEQGSLAHPDMPVEGYPTYYLKRANGTLERLDLKSRDPAGLQRALDAVHA
jgi:hypothetical protein